MKDKKNTPDESGDQDLNELLENLKLNETPIQIQNNLDKGAESDDENDQVNTLRVKLDWKFDFNPYFTDGK